MTALLTLLSANKGHLTGYSIMLLLVVVAYIAQAERINDLSLELGELRATDKYQTQIIEHLTDNCAG